MASHLDAEVWRTAARLIGISVNDGSFYGRPTGSSLPGQSAGNASFYREAQTCCPQARLGRSLSGPRRCVALTNTHIRPALLKLYDARCGAAVPCKSTCPAAPSWGGAAAIDDPRAARQPRVPASGVRPGAGVAESAAERSIPRIAARPVGDRLSTGCGIQNRPPRQALRPPAPSVE